MARELVSDSKLFLYTVDNQLVQMNKAHVEAARLTLEPCRHTLKHWRFTKESCSFFHCDSSSLKLSNITVEICRLTWSFEGSPLSREGAPRALKASRLTLEF
jgi:hypothetical protein